MAFLHGYLSCKESFYYQIKELSAAGYACYAPDMPSFGGSEAVDGAWSVGDYALWLKDFLAANDIIGAHIIAHSFGARVAIKAISEDNNLCGKLVITGGAGIVKPRSQEYMRQVKRYRRVKKLFPGYAEKHFGSEEYRLLSPDMKESYKKIVNEDLSQAAKRIYNRVLLIYGEDDDVTPYSEEGVTFGRLMPDARLVKTRGGHFCFSQYPNVFNGLVLEFLGETPVCDNSKE